MTLSFQVQLHGPFLIGTGTTDDGLDDVADQQCPLPGSALKGLMRASALHALALPESLVAEVFGKRGAESAWAWGDAGEPGMFDFSLRRSRNRIDTETGVAAGEALATVQEIWLRPGCVPAFQIEPLTASPPDWHRKLLVAAAFGVTAVGKWRNRGMGAASIRPATELTAEEAAALANWVVGQRGLT